MTADELYVLCKRLSEQSHLPGAGAADREDLCNSVYLKVMNRMDIREPEAYLRRALQNAWRSQGRRTQRAARAAASSAEARRAAGPREREDLAAPLDAGRLLHQMRGVYEQLTAEALATRPERYREGLKRDCEQVWALCFVPGVTLRDEVPKDPAAGAGELAFRTERNRLFQRHKRARDALRQARERLLERGEALDEDLSERLLAHLLRCQTRARRASGGEDD